MSDAALAWEIVEEVARKPPVATRPCPYCSAEPLTDPSTGTCYILHAHSCTWLRSTQLLERRKATG